jgi:hypothetical protein
VNVFSSLLESSQRDKIKGIIYVHEVHAIIFRLTFLLSLNISCTLDLSIFLNIIYPTICIFHISFKI